MQTRRLSIRRFAEEDWQDLYEYLSDEEVVKFEPYPVCTQEQSKDVAQHFARSKDFWAICLNGKVIGQVYLAEKDQQTWEVGYVFSQAYQKHGYATEAVIALIEDTFKQGAHRIIANCDPENEPSWKLLERVGFLREGHERKNIYFETDSNGTPLWKDTFNYGLLEENWQKLQLEKE